MFAGLDDELGGAEDGLRGEFGGDLARDAHLDPAVDHGLDDHVDVHGARAGEPGHGVERRLGQRHDQTDGFEHGFGFRQVAFIGVRSCELHAMAIQDRVFMGGQHVDSHYKSVRERLFIVAVNCGQAGGTCFCVSMGTGPDVKFGFDLALTEVMSDGRHYFVVEVGSARGAEVMAQMPHREASQAEVDAASGVVQQTAGQMGRALDTAGIRDLLYQNFDHPRWDEVASRCLACANCTLVCPTCFCSTVEDTTDVAGTTAQRTRRWDSCFTMDFSLMHPGSIRSSATSRYRQWMTHKLAAWYDQFGTSGCVGCGRCITWCPVGIDITQELRAIRASRAEGASENAGTVDRENADS